jgi:hypothetical protein
LLRRLGIGRRVVPVRARRATAPKSIAGEIQHRSADVRERIVVTYPTEAGQRAGERLLHDLLGVLASVDQQTGQPHEARELDLVDVTKDIIGAFADDDPSLGHARDVLSHLPSRRLGRRNVYLRPGSDLHRMLDMHDTCPEIRAPWVR